METNFLSYFLPEGILSQFEITGIFESCSLKDNRLEYHIHLEEKNQLPNGYKETDYESKGFFKSKQIVDFSIRGRAVYLIIKRRRWRNKLHKNEHISSDCTFITEGAKITQELSDFLKGGSGDES